MNKNNAYTFTTLFCKRVPIGNGESEFISEIMIPRIQRPYAQGRTDPKSTDVRNSFLDDIFSVLCGEKPGLDLNFVYGKVSKPNGKWTMELLDGQQRLTTLFLLYWYLLQRGEIPVENEPDVEKAIGAFTYETRKSSELFCALLAEKGRRLPIGGEHDITPRKAIQNLMDYVMSFNDDPTVSAMLVMLDAIHDMYKNHFPDGGKGVLFGRLESLRFRVLSLTDYNLSEELYIKMNARGLELTPFENFKADFLGLMERDERSGRLVDLETGRDVPAGTSGAVPFKTRFAIRLDTRWCDLFWDAGNPPKYDRSYMRFFSRFFAASYVLEHCRELQKKYWPAKEGYESFSHYEDDPFHYRGIKEFKILIENFGSSIHYFDDLSALLDLLLARKNEFLSAMKPLWELKDPDWFLNGDAKFEQKDLIVAAAAIEFLRLFSCSSADVFVIWMKCVNCIVENTDVNDIPSMVGTVRRLSDLLAKIAEGKPKSVQEFIGAMAAVRPTDYSAPVDDELEKARRIASSADAAEAGIWRTTFDEVARHPFLKGMIGFYYFESMTATEFADHVRLIGTLFGSDGIAPAYRSELEPHHWLLRAVFSQLTSAGQIENRYIVENNNKKYLKNLISSISNPDLKKKMHALFAKQLAGLDPGSDGKPSNAVLATLKAVVDKAPTVPATETWDTRETIRILREDEAFFQWALTRRKEKKHLDVKLYKYYGQYLARPDAQQIDTVILPVFRKAQEFAASIGLEYVGSFDSACKMFVGKVCSLRKLLDNIVPGAYAEIRFGFDYGIPYLVDLSVSWPVGAMDSEREDRFVASIGGEQAYTVKALRRSQIFHKAFSPSGGGTNTLSTEDLKEKINELVNLDFNKLATNHSPLATGH